MNGKRRSWVLLILVISFLASCGEREVSQAPDDLLPPETMVGLLIDIYKTEAMIASFGQNYDSSQHLFDIVEPDILLRHEATDEAFKQSYAYYLDHPNELIRIYTAVVDTLSYREQVLTQEGDKNADSF